MHLYRNLYYNTFERFFFFFFSCKVIENYVAVIVLFRFRCNTIYIRHTRL